MVLASSSSRSAEMARETSLLAGAANSSSSYTHDTKNISPLTYKKPKRRSKELRKKRQNGLPYAFVLAGAAMGILVSVTTYYASANNSNSLAFERMLSNHTNATAATIMCHTALFGEVAAGSGDMGAILVAFFIIAFTFAGLAIVCDEFFQPSLEAISEALSLSPDVAGATFLAAGSSAPELFTSLADAFGDASSIGEQAHILFFR